MHAANPKQAEIIRAAICLVRERFDARLSGELLSAEKTFIQLPAVGVGLVTLPTCRGS